MIAAASVVFGRFWSMLGFTLAVAVLIDATAVLVLGPAWCAWPAAGTGGRAADSRA